MKLSRMVLAVSLFIAAAAVVPSYGQTFTSAGSIRTIENQVQKKILMLPRYEVFDSIGFQVNGDTVTLTGKVRNAVNRKDAERSVAKIAGVNQVVNNIEVLPVGSFDESIRARLYHRLSASGGLSRYLWPTNPSVRLIVDGGHVSLEGFVATRGDYNTMNILAHGISGVFSVENNLVVNSERVR